MTSREVVRDAGSASDVFFLRLGQLFNTVNIDNDKFERNDGTTLRLRRCQELASSKPMPEDFQTRGIYFFEAAHEGIDWKDPEFLSDDDLVPLFPFSYQK
jgi:hypothetical protein